jgi:RNA polymerase sigma-70 factor (ECF subfamily)
VKGECILYLGEGEALRAAVPDGAAPPSAGVGPTAAPAGDTAAGKSPRRSCLSLLSDEALVGIALGEAAGAGLDGTTAGGRPRPQDHEAAFAALTERHYKAVRRVVRAIMGTSADADDAVQSAFLSAYRSLGSLKDRSRFKYWVRIIAVNEARDLMRCQVDMEGFDALLTLPEAAQDRIPPQAAEATWLIEELNSRLPEQYMKVLYLRYYLDYTVNEVASMLGIQPGLVKWRANRARKLARQALSDSDAVSKDTEKDRKGGIANE